MERGEVRKEQMPQVNHVLREGAYVCTGTPYCSRGTSTNLSDPTRPVGKEEREGISTAAHHSASCVHNGTSLPLPIITWPGDKHHKPVWNFKPNWTCRCHSTVPCKFWIFFYLNSHTCCFLSIVFTEQQAHPCSSSSVKVLINRGTNNAQWQQVPGIINT